MSYDWEDSEKSQRDVDSCCLCNIEMIYQIGGYGLFLFLVEVKYRSLIRLHKGDAMSQIPKTLT